MARLTQAQWEEAKRRKTAGESWEAIAATYGTSHQALSARYRREQQRETSATPQQDDVANVVEGIAKIADVARDESPSRDGPRRMMEKAKALLEPPKMGRPSVYLPEFHVEQAFKFALLGLTNEQMADLFGIALSTFHCWRNEHAEFSDAVDRGKEIADAEVVHSLYRKAIGFTVPAEKVFCSQGEIVRADTVAFIPPSEGAAMNWLCNRQPKLWRQRIEAQEEITDTETQEEREAREQAFNRAMDNAAMDKDAMLARAQRLNGAKAKTS